MSANYDAIRPETVPDYDPDIPATSDWSECETCKKIVHVEELVHLPDEPLDTCFTHNGHVA